MRWGITLDQLYKGCHEHRDSAVARRELDERSGKFGEADGAIQETDCSHRGFAVAFALAVPSAGNTLPSQRHVVVPRRSCSTGEPSLATPATATSSNISVLHFLPSTHYLHIPCFFQRPPPSWRMGVPQGQRL